MPMRALCERYTITRDQVIRLAVVWELPRRHDRRLRQKPKRMPDPTPREIAQACREIQATWTEQMREERRVAKPQPVTLKRITLTDEAREELDNQADEVSW